MQHQLDPTPISTIDEGVELIKSFDGNPEDFKLAIPESLLDPIGIFMTIITDSIFWREWEPDGFLQRDGYRVFSYKRWE